MSEPEAGHKTRVGAKRALVLLFAINLFNYLDRTVLFALSIPIRDAFQLSEKKFGDLAAAFLYAYMVGAPILGMLATRMSRWWLVAISVALWSLATGLTGLAGTFGVLMLSRVLVGLGEAGYGPSAPALISDYFAPDKRGKVMSLFYLAIPVGSALGYIYGGQMFKATGNWHSAFWYVVPPGLLLAALCLLMRDPGNPVKKRAAEPRSSFLQDLKKLIRIPSYVANTAAMTAMTFVIGGMQVWVPEYLTLRILTEQGLSPFLYTPEMRDMAVVVAEQKKELLEKVTFNFGIIVVVAGIVATFMGGWLADRLRNRVKGAYFVTSGGAILLSFPCILAMLWLPFPLAWGAVFGAVFFLFFNTGPANTALANVTTPSLRATAFAVNIFVIHALGDAISPSLIGWIVGNTSWTTAFIIVSPLVLVASAIWFLGSRYLQEDERRAEEG